MKVKLNDGTELECSVEEFIEFKKIKSTPIKFRYGATETEIKQFKENPKTRIMDYIKEFPMTPINKISKILNVTEAEINKAISKFGGLKQIRKSLNLPLRVSTKTTINQCKAMSFVAKRGREIIHTHFA